MSSQRAPKVLKFFDSRDDETPLVFRPDLTQDCIRDIRVRTYIEETHATTSLQETFALKIL